MVSIDTQTEMTVNDIVKSESDYQLRVDEMERKKNASIGNGHWMISNLVISSHVYTLECNRVDGNI